VDIIRDLTGMILVALILMCIIYVGTFIAEWFGMNFIVGFAVGYLLVNGARLMEERKNEKAKETEDIDST